MATQIWDGGAGTAVLSTAANWTNDTAPVTGESFGWTADSNDQLNPTSSMDAFATFDADRIFVEPGYTKDIGANGADLDVNSFNQVIHRGSGKMWLKSGGGTSDSVIVIGTAPDPNTEVMNVTCALGSIDVVAVLRNKVTIDANAVVNNVCCGSGENPNRGAYINITNGADVNMGYCDGGRVVCQADIDEDLIIHGGEWIQRSATIAGTVVVWGGLFSFEYAGTIPLVIQYGGTIDLTRLGGQKTFTEFIRFGGRCIGLGEPILAGTLRDYTA